MAALSFALSLVFPPFGFVGGGIMGLATLRNGLAEGALVASAAITLSAVVVWFLPDIPTATVVFMIVTGFPILLLAATLRYTRSLATTMATAGLCTAIAVIAFHVAIDDPLSWWQEQLRTILIQSASGQGVAIDAETTAKLERLIDALAPMMIGLPAGVMSGSILTLLLARWWHAILDNPGGFGKEFQALRFDPRLAIFAIIIGAIVIFVDQTGGVSDGFLRIFIILYLFQGLAVSHGIIVERGASRSWLLGLYLLLFFYSYITTALLAIIGLMDTWFDFRTRAMGKQHPGKP